MFVIVVVWDPWGLSRRGSYSNFNCSVTLIRWRRFLILLLLIHKLLILLPSPLYFLLSLLPLLPLSLKQLLPVPLQLSLEALLLLNLLPLLVLLPPLLLVDLVLEHSLQILLLLLLPLVLHLRDLREPVHRARDRRPGVLKGLLELRGLVVRVVVGLSY